MCIVAKKDGIVTQPTCIFTWTYESIAKHCEGKLVGADSDSGVRNGDAEAIPECGKE